MSDIQLTAGIDFRQAEQQVDAFVRNVETKVRTLKDITAKAQAAGGSQFRPGAGGNDRTGLDIARQELANLRALEAAKNRVLGLDLRIQRQLGGSAELTARGASALDAYNRALATHGTRTAEGVKAQSAFRMEMTRINGTIAEQGGLLTTLNRGFGSLATQLGTVASGVSVVGGRVGAVAGSFASVSAAAGASSRALAAFGAAAAPVAAVAVVVAALAAGLLTAGAAMADVTDRFNLMIGKLNAATGSMTSANALFAETFNIAQRVGVAMDDVGTSMNRFAAVGKEVGLTNTEVSGLVETFLRLGKVSGQTAQESAAALTQLTQALASGRLQGDEYKSLAENMPTLTREIAKGMGVATGELKKLASEGLVTTDIVLRALSSMKDKVNADFAMIPDTVAQINARIGNEWDMLLSNLDKRLHLSDLYKFMLKLPLMALEGANKLVGAKVPAEHAKDLQTQINNVDDKIRRTPFEWARKGLRDQRTELVKELDGIQTDLVRSAVDAGQQTIDAENRAWEQRVDTAKRGAQELRAENDAVFKANEDYRKSVEKLDKAKPFIGKDEYQQTLDAITDTRDKAIERANKAANAMTVEERAVWNTTKAYDALRLELSNAKVATEALQSGDMTLIDVKANERVTDFLIDFAKRANVVGASLQDLASMAGISLDALRDGFRAIEVEAAKRNALKRSKDLATETDETNRLAHATLLGSKAEAEMSKAIEVERQIRALGLDAKDKDLAALREEIRVKLDAAEAAKAYQRAAQEGMSILEQYSDGATQLRLRLERLNATRDILAKNGGLTAEMAQAFDRAAFEAVKSTNTIEGAFARAAENIGDALGNAFERAFEKGKLDAKDLLQDLKSIFGRMVFQAFIQPVIANAMTPVGSTIFGAPPVPVEG